MTDLSYRRPISTWWWLRKRSYFIFVMRELSSVFVAWLVVYLLLFIRAVGRGPTAYDDFPRLGRLALAGRAERGRWPWCPASSSGW